METQLGEVTLKSGERMTLLKVTAPEPAWADRVIPFLAHKSDLTLESMRRAYAAGLDALVLSDFLGVLDCGEVVGNITTAEHLGVALLQHVFTPDHHRRKGICSALMEVLCNDFRAAGGRAMYLGTGYDTPPYHIYVSFGFRGRGESGKMTWTPEEGFEEAHFAPGPAVVRDTRWDDWPLLEALYAVSGQWQLKSFQFQLVGHAGYEGQYPQLRDGMEKGSVLDVKVLQKADGAVVGHAVLAAQSLWQRRPLVLDVMVHANFYDRIPALLEAVRLPADRKVQAFCDLRATEKMQALEAVGLIREGTFRNLIADEDGEPLGVAVYGNLAEA